MASAVLQVVGGARRLQMHQGWSAKTADDI
jgi:hypothetical protein